MTAGASSSPLPLFQELWFLSAWYLPLPLAHVHADTITQPQEGTSHHQKLRAYHIDLIRTNSQCQRFSSSHLHSPTSKMEPQTIVQKSQPWKKNWPPAENKACPNGIEYGVEKGGVVVVDGTSANVKPKKATDATEEKASA
jgi:hypothetical protein